MISILLWVVGWCDGSGQCWGVQLIWITVGQEPTALAVGAGRGCLDIFFSYLSFFSFFLPLSGRRPNIDCNTVSKGRYAQNNQPTIVFVSLDDKKPFQNGIFS